MTDGSHSEGNSSHSCVQLDQTDIGTAVNIVLCRPSMPRAPFAYRISATVSKLNLNVTTQHKLIQN